MAEENKKVELKDEELKCVTGGVTAASFDSLNLYDCLASIDASNVVRVEGIEEDTITVRTAYLYSTSLEWHCTEWSSNTSTMKASDLSGYYKCTVSSNRKVSF